MKYLLTFVRDQEKMFSDAPEDMKAGMEAWNAFNREALDAGVLIANEALELPKTARTVEVTDAGEHAVTDGPFAETKEQLGGFCLIDCDGLEEAIGWAKRVPMRPGSKVEVRAVMDLSPYGYEKVTLGPLEASA